MNNSFLEHVAEDLIRQHGNNLSRIAVVFPNKRASLFMNEYLARLSDRPIWSPTYITISDLFRNHTQRIVGDPIKLVSDLQKTFVKCTGKEVSLDQFYGWGQLLISDFDDIDKNMADADKVFANLENIHELDDVSFLTEEQRRILQAFFSNFSEDHNTELKQRFIILWSHLADIYHGFNDILKNQNLAYEGALYREVVNDESIEFAFDTYVFVGFNVLQKVEQTLFKRLKQQGKAKFYWDFDDYYMSAPQHEAGYYIRKYLSDFPNELNNRDENIYHQLEESKDITFMSGKTEDIQARYISEWLNQDGRIEAGRKTAIVLCDESLLQTVIHCIPPSVEKINVTTGFPLSQSPVSSLVITLIHLQLSGHIQHSDQYRLTAVKRILRHPYTPYISPNDQQLSDLLDQDKLYFPHRSQLSLDEGMALLFEDIEDDPDQLKITRWLATLLQRIGKNGNTHEDAFFQESVFRMYTIINRVASLIEQGDLLVNRTTYERIITQIIKSTSIPFHGEPAEGIQIMGVLETRNLDFDHLLVLSCNEGNMPKGVDDSSFIPHSIREAYELTTINNKIAIYSYYFHRLLQRASDITFTYNNSTEGSQTGEMSRFMLQLLVERKGVIRRLAMKSGQQLMNTETQQIEKDERVLQKLNQIQKLSPSAINSYLRCPLLFYYHIVAGLKEPEAEDLDDMRMFGNIFHHSAFLIYQYLAQQNGLIQKEAISNMLNKNQGLALERIVDQAYNDILFKVKNNQQRPEYNGLQLINRKVILTYLHRLLDLDKQLAPFSIRFLEKDFYTNLTFPTSTGKDRTITLGGFIDRLDEIIDSNDTKRIRVIDYKTGKPMKDKLTSIEEIFDPQNVTSKHSDYFLQTFLYAAIIKNHQEVNPDKLPVSPALLFIQNTAAQEYDPTLSINDEKITDISSCQKEFEEQLQKLLAEIFDPEQPFVATDDLDRCKNCAFNQLCGRYKAN